jgi:hypothetical protein
MGKMKERPILFSAPMVRAILEGRKTMTRRVIKPHPTLFNGRAGGHDCGWPIDERGRLVACPYGQPGDRLWVRETFQTLEDFAAKDATYYRADGKKITALVDGDKYDLSHKWRPSIFMPRALSRITLEITSVRVERVQDISEADAIAEGCIASNDDLTDGYFDIPARSFFEDLWDSINAKLGYGWDANPWVWVVEFKRVK